MFSNLNAEMARNKLTIKALAEKTGINYESLKTKCLVQRNLREAKCF